MDGVVCLLLAFLGRLELLRARERVMYSANASACVCRTRCASTTLPSSARPPPCLSRKPRASAHTERESSLYRIRHRSLNSPSSGSLPSHTPGLIFKALGPECNDLGLRSNDSGLNSLCSKTLHSGEHTVPSVPRPERKTTGKTWVQERCGYREDLGSGGETVLES